MNNFTSLLLIWVIVFITYQIVGFEATIINSLVLIFWSVIPEKKEKKDEDISNTST